MYSLGTGTTGSRFLGKLNLYWIMRFKKEEGKQKVQESRLAFPFILYYCIEAMSNINLNS